MIIRKRNWTHVYLDPESDVENALLVGGVEGSHVFDWLRENVNGWRWDGGVIHNLRGDNNDYCVLRFAQEEEAYLFKINFQTKTAPVLPSPPVWRDDPADRTGITVPKSSRCYWMTGRTPSGGRYKGKSVQHCYHTERNAAGYYIAWTLRDGEIVARFAARKKKAVIAWCVRRANRP